MILDQIKNIVVIAGCQRSGTTLTGQILGANRQAILIDETDDLYEWVESSFDAGLKDNKALNQILAKSDSKYRSQYKRIAVLQGRRKLRPEIDTLVLKAPNLTYSFDKLHKLGKNIHIIYPVRDPRAVVASMEKLNHIDMVGNQVTWMEKSEVIKRDYADEIKILKDKTLLTHIRRALVWKIKSGMFARFEEAGHPPFVFNYEDLVADPAKYSKAMAKHCGLLFDERMLGHEDVYRGIAPGLTVRTRPIDTSSLRKWRNRLNPLEAMEVMEMAGDVAIKLGYGQGNYEKFDETAPTFSREVFESPIILTGRGGSGTRLISEIAQKVDIFLGNRLNASQDSTEWVDLIYEFAIKKALADSSGQPFKIDHPGLFLDKTQDVLEHGEWDKEQPWGLKLPETMLIAPELMSIFPKAKLVHLIRHPITSSLRRTHMTSRMDNPVGRTVLRAAYKDAGRDLKSIQQDPEYIHNAVTWLYQVKIVHNFAMENLSSDNYHLVRFEDLFNRPVDTTKRLTRFMVGTSSDYIRPAGEKARLPSLDLEDPAIIQVWDICKELAFELGYMPLEKQDDLFTLAAAQ